MIYILFDRYIIQGWNFRIILSILSRTEEWIDKSQEISDHLKRLTDFTIESKKFAKCISYYFIFRITYPFSLSIM